MDNFDRLESFGIYKLARRLFDEFWEDSEIIAKDFRGRESVKQQVRSLDSVCSNIEEGYGRGFGRELPQHLKISRGEARESFGRYERCRHLLPEEVIKRRIATLNHIIGGWTKTINTIESRGDTSNHEVSSRHPPLATRHAI
jgi:four helix bundle protein